MIKRVATVATAAVVLCTLLMLTSVFAIAVKHVTCAGLGDRMSSSISGDWIVTGNETRRNELIVLEGDLIVEPGGSLTFINTTLYVKCSYDGEFGIRVKQGGTFSILDGSVIAAYNEKHRFDFYVDDGATFRMCNSELHGCGYTVYRGWIPGFEISADDVVIENCTISHNLDGIYLVGSDNTVIKNCVIRDNSGDGIICSSSSNVTISGCIVIDNDVDCYNSSVTITGCILEGSDVRCDRSPEVSIVGNVFIDAGIDVWGLDPKHYPCDVRNNTVNGRPIYYIFNASDIEVPSDAGQVIVALSENIRIVGVNISHTNVGVKLMHCNNVLVKDSTLTDNGVGVDCDYSFNVRIRGCNISHNSVGIDLSSSFYVSITRCVVSYNKYDGISCFDSLAVEIHYCDIYSNEDLGLDNSFDGYLVNATHNWWGSPRGPQHKMMGDPRDPEEVYGNVVYEPWLTEPAVIEAPTRILSPVPSWQIPIILALAVAGALGLCYILRRKGVVTSIGEETTRTRAEGGRPLAITVLTVLAAVLGAQNLLPGATGLLAPGYPVAFMGGLLYTGVALFYLATAYGYWMGRSWAWALGMVLAILVIAFCAFTGCVLYDVYAQLDVALNATIIYLLTRRKVREWLRAPASRTVMQSCLRSADAPSGT